VNPTLRKFSSVERLEGKVLVLSSPLDDLREPTRVAHAWLPRIATVASVRERLMRVVLANEAGFPAGSLVLALSDGGQPIGPATVDEVTGSAVVLRQTIAALKKGDHLAGLKQAAKIASVAGKRVVIDAPGAFAPGTSWWL